MLIETVETSVKPDMYWRYNSYVRLINTINNGVDYFVAKKVPFNDIVEECDRAFRFHLDQRSLYSKYETFESKVSVDSIAQPFLADSMAELLWLFNEHHKPHNTTHPFINSSNQTRVILMPEGENYNRQSIIQSAPSLEEFLYKVPSLLNKRRLYSGLIYCHMVRDDVDFEEIGTARFSWENNQWNCESSGISKKSYTLCEARNIEYSVEDKICTSITPQS